MNPLKQAITAATLAASLLFVPVAFAQQQGQNINPGSDAGKQGATPNWTTEQLLTSTVHDAWILSGKNEATFFEMVAQLADLSAKNRNVKLPDSEAAGRRMGDYIKRSAKTDTDQLLYAVVDKAVVMTTHAPAHPAGTRN